MQRTTGKGYTTLSSVLDSQTPEQPLETRHLWFLQSMSEPASTGEFWKDGHLWEYEGRNRFYHSPNCPCSRGWAQAEIFPESATHPQA